MEKSEEIMNKCPFDPEPLKGIPLGQFHCPDCGQMIIAGVPHVDYSEEKNNG